MLLPYLKKNRLEAGCDEAGRGCLAGPVVAAAVILPASFKNKEITDSKQLTEHKRMQLRSIIQQNAISWAVAYVDPQTIDVINILNASFLAMHQALDQLQIVPEHILVDGNRFHQYREIPHTCVIKGDGKYLSIAAASILAKTYRDEYMQKIHPDFPDFNWQQNKGYPTVAHRSAIKLHGSTVHHRMSFTLLPQETSDLEISEEL